jgi:hypothetical protein
MTKRSDFHKDSIFNLRYSMGERLEKYPARLMSGVYRLIASRFIGELFWKL